LETLTDQEEREKREKLPKNILRVNGWDEIEKYIKELS
jgi:hypothetical protein